MQCDIIKIGNIIRNKVSLSLNLKTLEENRVVIRVYLHDIPFLMISFSTVMYEAGILPQNSAFHVLQGYI